jgi:phosphonate transport system substrate-binding protein
MNKMGIKPEEFFANVVYAGSHENAIIALQQGQVDAAFNWWNDENESMLRRMERKDMAKYDDFRMIFKSDMIVNSPVAYLNSMPEDLKARIRTAFLDAPKKAKVAFDKLSDGKNDPWETVDHKAYEPIVELNKFVDNLRKK